MYTLLNLLEYTCQNQHRKMGKYFGWPRLGASKYGMEDGEFLASLWYWPTTPKSLYNGPNALHTCYVNHLA